jgi:hypothetical protein
MATKKTEVAAPLDSQRMSVALLMVSDLFGGGQIPKPGTPIDQWTKQVQVQIAMVANLIASPRPAQNGFGWHTVVASEIGACKFIEDLIGLAYSKLQPEVMPHAQMTAHVEEYAALLAEATNALRGKA